MPIYMSRVPVIFLKKHETTLFVQRLGVTIFPADLGTKILARIAHKVVLESVGGQKREIRQCMDGRKKGEGEGGTP